MDVNAIHVLVGKSTWIGQHRMCRHITGTPQYQYIMLDWHVEGL